MNNSSYISTGQAATEIVAAGCKYHREWIMRVLRRAALDGFIPYTTHKNGKRKHVFVDKGAAFGYIRAREQFERKRSVNVISVDGWLYGINGIRQLRDERDAYRELLIHLMTIAPMRTFASEHFLAQMTAESVTIEELKTETVIAIV